MWYYYVCFYDIDITFRKNNFEGFWHLVSQLTDVGYPWGGKCIYGKET